MRKIKYVEIYPLTGSVDKCLPLNQERSEVTIGLHTKFQPFKLKSGIFQILNQEFISNFKSETPLPYSPNGRFLVQETFPKTLPQFVLLLISLQRWQHKARNETKHFVSPHLIGPQS